GERLVDLEQVHVTDRPAYLVQQVGDRAHRGGGEPLRLVREGGVADDLRQRLDPAAGGFLGRQQHGGGGAVGDRRGAGRGDRAVLPERRTQGRDLGHVGLARLLVGGDLDLALAGGDLDRDDLALERTIGKRRLGAVHRL